MWWHVLYHVISVTFYSCGVSESSQNCAINFYIKLWYSCLFSSPGHKVPMVGYYDSPVSVVVRCLSSTMSLNDISTTWPIASKLHKNDPWVVLYQSCSKNEISLKLLVAMATNRKKDPPTRLFRLLPQGQYWPSPGVHFILYRLI